MLVQIILQKIHSLYYIDNLIIWFLGIANVVDCVWHLCKKLKQVMKDLSSADQEVQLSGCKKKYKLITEKSFIKAKQNKSRHAAIFNYTRSKSNWENREFPTKFWNYKGLGIFVSKVCRVLNLFQH